MKKDPGLDIFKSKDEGGTPLLPPEDRGDSTVAQTLQDVKDKAEAVKLNKDGTERKRRARKSLSDSDAPGVGSGLGTPGFTEDQVKATFKGLFSVTALATNCNVWFLADPEADCFVPSSTLALNQTFPSVAQSKWGAITLASLSFMAVVVSKTLLYAEYKSSLRKRSTEQVIEPAPAP